jgi:multidrug efflux pump subunit AcrA (membrane-fusion protein)
MDIKREPVKNRKKVILIGAAVLGLIVVTVLLSKLKPAAPTVDLGTIYLDTVEQGEMVLEVRGPGTLVPEDIRWITAVTSGRVEKLNLLPGVSVEPSTVLLELVNPDVEIATLNADRQQTDAESQLVQLKTSLNSNRLAQAAAVANLRSTWLGRQAPVPNRGRSSSRRGSSSRWTSRRRRSWPTPWANRWSTSRSG